MDAKRARTTRTETAAAHEVTSGRRLHVGGRASRRAAFARRAGLVPLAIPAALFGLAFSPPIQADEGALARPSIGVADHEDSLDRNAPVVRREIAALIRRGEQARTTGRIDAATSLLKEALSRAGALDDASLRLAATGAYGGALIDAGRANEAQALLQPAVEETRRRSESALEAALENELARALERQDSDTAVKHYSAAAAAAERAGDRSLAFRSLANAAHMAARQGQRDRARRLGRQAIEQAGASPIDVRDALSWIRLGRAFAMLAAAAGSDPDPEPDTDAIHSDDRDRDRAVLCFERGLAWANEHGDRRARSHARGALAGLLARGGQLREARSLSWKALRDAQELGEVELQARWHAQLGRIARLEGRRDEAIRQLERAVARLETVRPALARAGSDPLPSEALDRIDAETALELVDLLLARAETAGDVAAADPDLLAAQAALERMKAVELRDYFRDDCVDAYREKITDPTSVSSSAAIIYPISLPDRLSILVSHHTGIRQFVVPISDEQLDGEVDTFRRWLVNRILNRYRLHARQLHEWIIDPILPHLTSLEVDTLVFVPGGRLRTIPLAALHDGERFLVERYAVAHIPALELTGPRALDREDPKLFLGGISKARFGFSELSGVAAELGAVRERFGGTLLLDEAFEREAMIRTLERRNFDIVHLATHAQFSETARDSFLLTWDGRLGMDALAEAVGGFRYRDTPLELLVLSACETAAGDERAALGLAGLAVKAGARSALATLWSVSDIAAQRLVTHFYAALSEPGISRAEALRRAQRDLIDDPDFGHPANWAAFLLISNWL